MKDAFGRRALLRGTAGALLGVAAVMAIQTPAAATQSQWRFCWRCSGLWFSGNPTRGGCPAGNVFDGGHHSEGSGDYVLKVAADGGAGQLGWCWCGLCQGMFFNGNVGNGVCPSGTNYSGGGHYPNSPLGSNPIIGSAQYRIEDVDHRDRPGGQDQWRWCVKCAGLFFDGNSPGASGLCPADHARHSRAGSGNYVLRQTS